MSGEKTKNRNHTLDMFRALAIIGVLFYHYLLRWAPPFYTRDVYGYNHEYSYFFALGQLGVHAFFVLSGYFIFLTLVRSCDAFDFLARRLLRIYPAFILAALMVFAAMTLFGIPDFKVRLLDLIVAPTLLADNLGFRNVDGAFWSLAVEFKFYVWVAVIWHVMGKRFWLGLIALQVLGLLVSFVSFKIAKEILLYPYLPFFITGVALAYQTSEKNRLAALSLYAVSLVFFALNWKFVQIKFLPENVGSLTILALMALIVLVTLSGRNIRVAPLAFIGLISYEIYLVHQSIGVTIIAFLRGHQLPDLAAVLIAVAIVFPLAWLLHEVCERLREVLYRHYRQIRYGSDVALGSA